MPKLKDTATSDNLFDTHAGTTNSSRTSNTYSSIGTQGGTHVPAARMQAFKLPSRMGNNLHYPDGTVLETDHGRNPANR